MKRFLAGSSGEEDVHAPLLGSGYGTFEGEQRSSRNRDVLPPDVEEEEPRSGGAVFAVMMLGDTLKSFCTRHSLSMDKLEALNVQTFRTLGNRNPIVGQVLVVGEGEEITIHQPVSDDLQRVWGQCHVVRKTDSLGSIALEYNTTPRRLREDNRLIFPVGEKGILAAGQVLFIRYINTVDSTSLHRFLDIVAGKADAVPKGYLLHTVQGGDTWRSLIESYNMSYKTLLQLNRLYFPVGVQVRLTRGQKLLVFDPNAPRIPEKVHYSEVVLKRQIHEVAPGETSAIIAERYGMTMDELRDQNRCYFPKGFAGHLKPGMKLVVMRDE